MRDSSGSCNADGSMPGPDIGSTGRSCNEESVLLDGELEEWWFDKGEGADEEGMLDDQDGEGAAARCSKAAYVRLRCGRCSPEGSIDCR